MMTRTREPRRGAKKKQTGHRQRRRMATGHDKTERANHIMNLQAELSLLKTRLDEERKAQVQFLNSLREILDFKPIPEDSSRTLVNLEIEDALKFLQRLVRAVEQRNQRPEPGPEHDPQYLRLR